MMSSIFIEKQHKQEILVVDRFQDVFESIMVFNQTFKITSCPDNMNGKYENRNIFETANILHKLNAIVNSANIGC